MHGVTPYSEYRPCPPEQRFARPLPDLPENPRHEQKPRNQPPARPLPPNTIPDSTSPLAGKHLSRISQRPSSTAQKPRPATPPCETQSPSLFPVAWLRSREDCVDHAAHPIRRAPFHLPRKRSKNLLPSKSVAAAKLGQSVCGRNLEMTPDRESLHKFLRLRGQPHRDYLRR